MLTMFVCMRYYQQDIDHIWSMSTNEWILWCCQWSSLFLSHYIVTEQSVMKQSFHWNNMSCFLSLIKYYFFYWKTCVQVNFIWRNLCSDHFKIQNKNTSDPRRHWLVTELRWPPDAHFMIKINSAWGKLMLVSTTI
jgi:hypothetical protein